MVKQKARKELIGVKKFCPFGSREMFQGKPVLPYGLIDSMTLSRGGSGGKERVSYMTQLPIIQTRLAGLDELMWRRRGRCGGGFRILDEMSGVQVCI